MLTPEQRSERYRDGWLASRRKLVSRLALSLTPAQSRAYVRWQQACIRVGVQMTTEERLAFLSDVKETI